MTDIGSLNSKGKSTTITDSFNHPLEISYFTFRSNIKLHLVKSRAPDNFLTFEFSLQLPKTSTRSNSFTVTIGPLVHTSTISCAY